MVNIPTLRTNDSRCQFQHLSANKLIQMICHGSKFLSMTEEPKLLRVNSPNINLTFDGLVLIISACTILVKSISIEQKHFLLMFSDRTLFVSYSYMWFVLIQHPIFRQKWLWTHWRICEIVRSDDCFNWSTAINRLVFEVYPFIHMSRVGSREGNSTRGWRIWN